MHLPQQCLSIKNIEVSVLALVRSHSVHHFISSQYGLLYVSLAPPLSACWPVSLSIKSQFGLISVPHILFSPPPRLKGKLLVGSLSRFVLLQADSRRHLKMGNYVRFNSPLCSSSDPLTLCWTSVPLWRPHPVGQWATGSGPLRWSVTRRVFYRPVTRPCSCLPTSTQSEWRYYHLHPTTHWNTDIIESKFWKIQLHYKED